MSPPNATLPKPPNTFNAFIRTSKPTKSENPTAIKSTKSFSTPATAERQSFKVDTFDRSFLAADPTALEYGTQEAITQKCKEESSEPKEEDGFSWFNNNVLGLFRVSPATERNKIVAFQQRQQTPASNTSSNSFKLFTVA